MSSRNARRYRSVCAALALAAAAQVVDTADAQQDRRFEAVKEAFSMQVGDRLKTIYFDRARADTCPQFNAMLASTANRVRLLAPYHGLPAETTPYITRGSQPNAVDFRIERPTCRIVLTIKRFSGGGPTGEVELPLQPRALDYPPPTANQADVVRASLDTNQPHDRSADLSRLLVAFNTDKAFDFSGLISVGPGHVTIYLVNASEELAIAARRNNELHAHELSISNQRSRVYVAVTREINVDGTWTKLFD
jgi:hypothetical protein